MNKAPNRPPIEPIISAAKILSSVGAFDASDASLITSEFETLITSNPSYSCLNTLNTNVLIVEAKNTFQVKEKDQNVFGFDISYANRDPPIGAPNAALTPAAVPTASNFLFSKSFLKY